MKNDAALAHIPESGGRWSGAPGNSVWFPDMDGIPGGSNNPYHPKTFKTLMLMRIAQPLDLPGLSVLVKLKVKSNYTLFLNGAIGVRYTNGYPDFSPFAVATVRLREYRDERYGAAGTMSEADKILAEKTGNSAAAVRQWINDRQFVWHERVDGRHIDLLCHDIHGNIPHRGGISANRARHGK
jgi:hypothetical protein